MIGTHLSLRLREGYKVFATYRHHRLKMSGVSFLPLNVEDRNWAKRIVYMAQPDIIIYAGGTNNIEEAELNPRAAQLLHAGGPATVSNVSEIFQPKFIYLSTCYAFDGTRGNYKETDTVLPATALGKAKLGGENSVRTKSMNYLILRSSPVFGRGNGQNLSFLDRLRMSLDRGQRIEVAAHEGHSFAPVEGLVDVVSRLVDTGLKNKIIHYGGLTRLSYFQFAQAFARKFKYDPALVVAQRVDQQKHVASEEFNEDYSLNSTNAVHLLKIKPLLMEESLDLIDQKLVPRL